jgi:hypothetical protein
VARRQKEADGAEAALETVMRVRAGAPKAPSTKRRTLAPRTRSATLSEKRRAAEAATQPKRPTLKVARTPAPPDPVQQRVERLENGMRLLAETFKRAFADLNASMEQLRIDVSQTATPADVERAVARTATPADVAHGAAQAVQPLLSSLDQLMRKAPSSSPALQEAMFRLMEGIDAAESIVQQALDRDQRAPDLGGSPAPTVGSNGDKPEVPDPSAIWGDEPVAAGGELEPDAEAEHHRRPPARRRVGWSGRAYANWKYRRSELS